MKNRTLETRAIVQVCTGFADTIEDLVLEKWEDVELSESNCEDGMSTFVYETAMVITMR